MSRQRVNILIADDEVFIREGLKEALDHNRYRVETVSDGRQAHEKLRSGRYHLTILDLRMPGPSGLELLDELRDRETDTQVIILTAHGNVSTAVEAMKKGAHDFLTKPVDLGHLRLVVERALDRLHLVRENRKLHNRLENADPFRRLVRNSESMQAASKLIKQVAQSDVPVLLRGETGVGKDLVARAIHERSKRSERPFVAVNCGGFTEELFASEIFGHKRGAFTGAHADKPGRFALAESGTLFLDEIGEVPIKNQIELLRALESHEYQPLGDPQVRHADVRIIAATNRNLERSVSEGLFREDLYYRLNVVPIDVPPLRQRQEDIPVLVETFLDEACRAQDQPHKRLSSEAMGCLLAHAWPGNVRELRNIVQRLVVTSQGRTVHTEQLPAHLSEVGNEAPSHFSVRLGSTAAEVEAELIRQTLQRLTTNRRKAAEILGMSVRALQYKIKQYDIT